MLALAHNSIIWEGAYADNFKFEISRLHFMFTIETFPHIMFITA